VATLIGTSGFGYEDWKGAFYPADLPGKTTSVLFDVLSVRRTGFFVF
jgi:uncharacterized protein YecE (DUF72 family)